MTKNKPIQVDEMTPEQNLEARAALFKTLGHASRLLILNLIRAKPRHVEELAAILHLSAPTVSHHLTKLSQAGLVQAKKEQYYQVYSLLRDRLDHSLNDMIFMPLPGMEAQVEQDAYRHKVLKTFIRQGRLVSIPAQQKKRLIVLEHLLESFEPGQRYPEREVNQILVEFHDDVASLRREMIMNKLMSREKGVYWRCDQDD